jgi:tetratricopeptide (TPR) repeat protein
VSALTVGLLGALLATNQPQSATNSLQQNTGAPVAIVNTNDPAETELEQLMAEDDDALDEVDGWIRTNNALAAAGAGESKEALNQRIKSRLGEVRSKYQDFLLRHPNSASGYLAYGTFLEDTGDEEAAKVQLENSRQIDPKNPAVWNDLANYYGERGPVTNAFAYYAKAIELDPAEPVYYQNFATTVYLFRSDARSFFGITEQQVFDKALALYRKAVQLDPENFDLATDYAETYYGIRPLRTNDALVAWTNALNVARNDVEREGVFIHLARLKTVFGRFAEAHAQLDAVTNAVYDVLKNQLARNLANREKAATNAVQNVPTNAVVPTNAPADK